MLFFDQYHMYNRYYNNSIGEAVVKTLWSIFWMIVFDVYWAHGGRRQKVLSWLAGKIKEQHKIPEEE